MGKLITRDDLRDVVSKGKQRGVNFILSKFAVSSTYRTKSAFNESAVYSANWWDIPYVQKRWAKMIFGDENLNHENYLIHTILRDRSGLRLLSLGSGSCGYEIKLAQHPKFENITCVDLSEFRISEAKREAQQKNLDNMTFMCADIDDFPFSKRQFDVVLFNASLHHFRDVEALLAGKISCCLKDSGYLVMNEYVGPNRLQFPAEQIKKINEAIKSIPLKFRKKYKSSSYKKSFSGSGLIRMILADPSECVDSASIMPSVHRHFDTLIEKPFGGNILVGALKDIAHNFVVLDEENKKVLDALFAFEDDYLKDHPSDYVFGVYSKK